MAVTTAAGTHREVEIKLDAAAGFRLPDLDDLPGVIRVEGGEVQELEAVYLDSADLQLARNSTTLRRRTGGQDEGWHLKLPAAKSGRIEIRRSLGPSVRAVPPELLGLVRLQLRRAPVAPVARITTRRTVHRLLGPGDVVLAEVADDQVLAEAMGAQLTTSTWREIEVELVQGDEDLLTEASRLLTAAGARRSDSPSKLKRALALRLSRLQPNQQPAKRTSRHGAAAGEIVTEYLRRHVVALIAEDPRVRISEDDAVHQMRVAARRLRTALASFRPLFAAGSLEDLRTELKWIGGLLGVPRDAEVMRARLIQDLAAQPAELVVGPVQQRVALELDQAYQAGHTALLDALNSERYLALIDALEAFTARPPFSDRGQAPASHELRELVARACRRVRRAVVGLDAVQDDASARDHHLHEVRITAKRARYAAEAVRPAVGKQAKSLMSVMSQLQETLGDHQDAVVERQWLQDLGSRAHANGESSFTFGLLHGLTTMRADHDAEKFAWVWKDAEAVMARWPG